MSDRNAAASPGRSWKHYISLGIAVITCPCHLPLLLVILAGTAVGGWLHQHTLLVLVVLLGIFVLALCHGLGAFNRRRSASEARVRRDAQHPPTTGVETMETKP